MMIGMTSPVQAELTSVEKAKLDEMIRTYIEKNPGVIRDALQQLAEREEKEQKLAALAFLEISEGDPVLGNPDGSLVIYEFSDYNCGYCKRVFGPIQEMLAEDDDIRFVVRSFQSCRNRQWSQHRRQSPHRCRVCSTISFHQR